MFIQLNTQNMTMLNYNFRFMHPSLHSFQKWNCILDNDCILITIEIFVFIIHIYYLCSQIGLLNEYMITFPETLCANINIKAVFLTCQHLTVLLCNTQPRMHLSNLKYAMQFNMN